MKKILVFILLSAILHAFLLFLKIKEYSADTSKTTSIEIVDRSMYEPVTDDNIVPADTYKDAGTQKEQIKPDKTPIVESTANNINTTSNQYGITDTQSSPVDKSDWKIIPMEYDTPPPTLTATQILQSIASNEYGPSRDMESIIQDVVDFDYPDGEDGVSFTDMSLKYESYFKRFAKSLYNEWQYPDSSAMKGEAGIVRVSFSITKDGQIINIKLYESSGYPALDKEVLRTLKSMKPVELPNTLNLNILHVNGFFIYNLRGEYRLY